MQIILYASFVLNAQLHGLITKYIDVLVINEILLGYSGSYILLVYDVILVENFNF